MKPNSTLTIFSFGYWGWGTAVPEMVKMIDLVEKSRGYAPPMFVDIRMNHAVRAPGFNGNSFQKHLGEKRVLNFKDLGNKRIGQSRGPSIQINRPESADALLDIILERFQKKQRTIFFCSCLNPREGHSFHCHRYTVSALLFHYAKNRKMKPIIIEWPGGEPAVLDLAINESEYKSLSKFPKTISFPYFSSHLSRIDFLSLPLSSILRFRFEKKKPLLLLSDRLQWRKIDYTLKVYPLSEEIINNTELLKLIHKEREYRGYNAHNPSILSELKEFAQSPLKEMIKKEK
jgi:hypothetical protein